METKYKLNVTEGNVYGCFNNNRPTLYMIIWERLANSGIIYYWAKSEEKALINYGFNPKFVKHTIVEINPDNMPMVVGGLE